MSKDVSVNSLVKLNQQQINAQLQLDNLEKELSTNPIFKQYLETKKKINEFEDAIKTEAEKILVEAGENSIKTDLVKITRVTRNNWKIEDVDKVDPDLIEYVPKLLTDSSKFEEAVEFGGGEIPGVSNKKSHYVKITWTNKESV